MWRVSLHLRPWNSMLITCAKFIHRKVFSHYLQAQWLKTCTADV